MNPRHGSRVSIGLALAIPVLAGCGAEEVPAGMLGAQQFASPRLSTSPVNVYACATCHVVRAPGSPDPGRLDPGFNLYDVVHRPSWWGGEMTKLLDAINFCLTEFMGGAALTATDDRARQVYEYLADNSPTRPAPALPMTIVKDATDLKELPGDAGRGRDVWLGACQRCHGDARTGNGRLSARASVVPQAAVVAFPDMARAAIVEKVRHGRFFNLAGTMPPYPREALSDQQLADLLVFLGL